MVVQVGVGLSVSVVGYADSALLVVSSRSFSDRFGLGGLSLLCMLIKGSAAILHNRYAGGWSQLVVRVHGVLVSFCVLTSV